MMALAETSPDTSTKINGNCCGMDLGAEAAEILRSVDLRAAELNQTALDAAREGDAARQNARRAAALARRYKQQQQPQHLRNRTSLADGLTSTDAPPAASAPRLTTEAKLLNVSLELERCQRALTEEKEQHSAAKKALQEAQSTAETCRNEVQQVLQSQEALRQDLGRQLDDLQLELEQTKQRLQTADQDANLALELAQNNAHARQEMEDWYAECLEHNDALTAALEQIHHYSPELEGGGTGTATLLPPAITAQMGTSNEEKLNSQKLLHEEDSTYDDMLTANTKPSTTGSSNRAMVANGRLLLQEFRNGNGDAVDTTDPSASSSSQQMTLVSSPSKVLARAQERRRHLAETRKPLENDAMTMMVPHASPSSSDTSVYGRIVNLLRQSGQRLALPGLVWNPPQLQTSSSSSSSSSPAVPVATGDETETLTQQYCQAVEREMERKQKELFELESFCALMEQEDKPSSSSST